MAAAASMLFCATTGIPAGGAAARAAGTLAWAPSTGTKSQTCFFVCITVACWSWDPTAPASAPTASKGK